MNLATTDTGAYRQNSSTTDFLAAAYLSGAKYAEVSKGIRLQCTMVPYKGNSVVYRLTYTYDALMMAAPEHKQFSIDVLPRENDDLYGTDADIIQRVFPPGETNYLLQDGNRYRKQVDRIVNKPKLWIRKFGFPPSIVGIRAIRLHALMADYGWDKHKVYSFYGHNYVRLFGAFTEGGITRTEISQDSKSNIQTGEV